MTINHSETYVHITVITGILGGGLLFLFYENTSHHKREHIQSLSTQLFLTGDLDNTSCFKPFFYAVIWKIDVRGVTARGLKVQ